jgi:hypothetical protein
VVLTTDSEDAGQRCHEGDKNILFCEFCGAVRLFMGGALTTSSPGALKY